MKFKERLLLLLMIQVVGFFCQHSFRKCTKEVSNCPITEELWYKRWNDVPCFGEGLNYTCMMAAGGVLVEACINEYEIRAFDGSRCPYIHSCDGTEPVLASVGKWTLCPEGVFGCPPSDHPVYTVYHMYKYPACIVRNVSELLTTTLPEETVSSPALVVSNITKNEHSNRRGNGSDSLGIIAGVTIGFVFVLLSIIAFCVWKVVRRRKLRRKKNDNDIKFCDYPRGAYEGSTPLLIDSDTYIKVTKETNVRPPFTPFDPETDDKPMHVKLDKGHSIHLNEETNLKRPCDSETEEETVHLIPGKGHSIPLTEETHLKRSYIPCDSETEEVTVHVTPDQDKHGFYKDFKERLLKFSKRVTEKIQMSPVQTFGNLPVDLLYAKVVIKTDARYVQMGYQYYEDTNLEKETKYIEKPIDLFYKYGDPTERIFMIGNAAHGKTTYCLWLLQHWNHAHSKRTRTQDEWGKEIGNFDFVFLVRLRDVQKCRGNVIDMICKDMLGIEDEENINGLKEALKSGNYRSLILIDGLDEWKPDLNVTSDTKFKGIPIIDDIKNCVIFITMRNWKIEEISMEINPEDRVVEILGLDENGLQKVTENVLLNHYGLNTKKPEDKLKYDTILNKIKNKTLTSIMNIPLIAVLCVQILYKGEMIGNSLTMLYTAMVNMLIERTQKCHKADKSHEHSNACYIHKPLLLKLGELAYKGLIVGKYIFEIPTETMIEEIGLTRSELKFSLDVGLLSREEAESTMTQKAKIYFFHTSVQEYLGAVYIAENEENRNSFCELLSNVEIILQFGNILVFLTGLNAELGSDISKRIVNIAKNDNEVTRYREFDMALLYHNKEVELLYKLQANCHRELTNTQLCTDASKQVLPYHVSDFYVSDESEIETIRATADILTHHHTEIKSVFMFKVPTDVENGIPDSLLTQYLDQTVSLQSLFIDGYNTNRTFDHISDIFSSLTALILYNITFTPEAISSLQTAIQSNRVLKTLGLVNIKIQINQNERTKLASLSSIIQILPDLPRLTTLRIRITNKDDEPVFRDVLSRLSHLHGISYRGTSRSDDEYDHDVVHTLCTWSELHWLYLKYVNMGNSGLQLPHDMLHLKMVVLRWVEMLPSAWNRFIESMLNINHQFNIHLRSVNIDKECLTLVRSSPQFRITRDEVDDVGTCSHNLHFTRLRVFPPYE